MAHILPLTANRSTHLQWLASIVLMKTFAFLVFLSALTASAWAQNSDLGILGGVSSSSSDARVGLQVNYARELVERPAGRLYVEVPLIIPVAPQHEANSLRLFVTPGIRYHFNVTNRTAVYATFGIGIATRPERPATSAAYVLGTGLDFRLNRRWSLRGDVRDTIASSTVSFDRNNPSAMFGFALHF